MARGGENLQNIWITFLDFTIFCDNHLRYVLLDSVDFKCCGTKRVLTKIGFKLVLYNIALSTSSSFFNQLFLFETVNNETF